jgi:hypothetical protein
MHHAFITTGGRRRRAKVVSTFVPFWRTGARNRKQHRQALQNLTESIVSGVLCVQLPVDLPQGLLAEEVLFKKRPRQHMPAQQSAKMTSKAAF